MKGNGSGTLRPDTKKAAKKSSKRKPIYQVIFDDFHFAIQSGLYQAGQKLPSVRVTSKRYGVSAPTVLQAYINLESAGLVEARERSGFFVIDPSGSPESRADAIEPMPPELGSMVRWIFDSADLKNATPIGFDAPSIELFPIRKLNSIMAAICRRQDRVVHEYSDVSGLAALRQVIARRLLADGCQLSPNELVVTSGGQEALHLCLSAVCQPGDIVVVESPTYYGILLAAEALNLKVIELPSDPRTGLRIDVLSDLLARDEVKIAAVVAMPNIGSPTGCLMPEHDKRLLVDLCLEKKIPLIEDDTNRELFYEGTRPTPLRAYDHSGNTVLCCSFSKTISPGLRVGFAAPGRYLDRTLDMKFCTSISTPMLVQLATMEFASSRAYDQHLKRLRAAFRSQMSQLMQTIDEHWPDDTVMFEPHGGNFIWIRLPDGMDCLSLHQAALRQRINIAPGTMFSAHRDLRQYIRLSAGRVWNEQIAQSVRKLGEIVDMERRALGPGSANKGKYEYVFD
ncbi:MAG TPA: PLP-dependent aminotransferase family protein [Woeseiaceae bacterium]|nr:PLP-dependent aminotransferase family protein [Woeseiaceae bacterium]